VTLVAGIDSLTQSCKVVIRDAGTGALVRSGSARHPVGTEVDPRPGGRRCMPPRAAGGLDDVEAMAVGDQQHGMAAWTTTGR
jgi:xylulokinase